MLLNVDGQIPISVLPNPRPPLNTKSWNLDKVKVFHGGREAKGDCQISDLRFRGNEEANGGTQGYPSTEHYVRQE